MKLKIENGKSINIVLSGVGGQGVLVASDIIVDVAMNQGFDTKKSEVHGMAQRGGSVVSQVRYGTKIYSPLIQNGHADIILAFEKLEALRYLDFLKPNGVIIFNTQQITPLTVYFSNVKYPEDILERCKKKTPHVISVDAIKIAEDLGNLKVLNSIMLGALSNHIEFSQDIWLESIGKRVPKKTIELNTKAFQKGRELIEN